MRDRGIIKPCDLFVLFARQSRDRCCLVALGRSLLKEPDHELTFTSFNKTSLRRVIDEDEQ